MLKALIALAIATMLAALLWYAKDYGSTGAELEQATAQIDTIETANQQRDQIRATDNANVMAAIDNTSWRQHQNQALKQQAADYERELQKARSQVDVVDTLSDLTIERMQLYADPHSVRQQLATH